MHSWRKRLTGRFHPALETAKITAPNIAALAFELKACATRTNGWTLMRQRNDWFQRRAVEQLSKDSNNGAHTVFAYSYAAENIFKFARERGWRTVLSQIDAGPVEERIVAGLYKESAAESHWEPAPAAYWDRWRAECALADQIVVNSSWSKDALLSEGIPAEKICVLPVAYEALPEVSDLQRHYPNKFSSERPLRVLFLGQVNLRKGVEQLFEAIKLLARENVEFWFVGPVQITVPSELKTHARVKWFGVAPRIDVARFYRDADVFMFPTLSDGFGITQLEAQSWKLPVVASRYCGEVVQDGYNGLILDEVSGEAIATALVKFLHSPETLVAMSEASGVSERFSVKTLAASLTSL